MEPNAALLIGLAALAYVVWTVAKFVGRVANGMVAGAPSYKVRPPLRRNFAQRR